MKQSLSRPRLGFTLIDLAITVAIIGILSAIAYPNFAESMRKVRRAEARAALMQLMQQQERYYSQYGLYLPFDSDTVTSATANDDAKKIKWWTGTTAKSSAYEIKGVACSATESTRNCIKLVATAGTTKVNSSYADSACGTLALTSTGTKTPDPASSKCW
jgi:type IV pilus assembly protein PilE